MNFENDPIADKVEKQMRQLKESGVNLTGGSEYNRVFEAFYKLYSQLSTPPQLREGEVEDGWDDKPLTECMVGRDTECNHPKCPVTDEDCKNGKYCTLPLYDWRQ